MAIISPDVAQDVGHAKSIGGTGSQVQMSGHTFVFVDRYLTKEW